LKEKGEKKVKLVCVAYQAQAKREKDAGTHSLPLSCTSDMGEQKKREEGKKERKGIGEEGLFRQVLLEWGGSWS